MSMEERLARIETKLDTLCKQNALLQEQFRDLSHHVNEEIGYLHEEISGLEQLHEDHQKRIAILETQSKILKTLGYLGLLSLFTFLVQFILKLIGG